jgi:thiol-disulfide isomerase/thioredoxin
MATQNDGDGKATPVSKLIWAGALAAVAGFAAVYLTAATPDNGEATTKVNGEQKTAAEPAGAVSELAGFVKKKAPEDLPEFTFVDGTGATRTLKDFKGKTVLLNLWATWCGPCRKEMPSLDRLQKALGSDKFEVIALSLDRAGPEAAKKFLDEIKVEALRLYIDSSMKAGNALKALGMPTTILIDPEGREVGRLPGPAEWDTDEAKALIKTAMTP